MATVRTFQQSFGGGEVTPEFFGRFGDAKYGGALAKALNFIILPHGPAANRPGMQFVRATKYPTKKVRLIPFTFSTTQTMVIEVGAGYFRFHTQGATLESAPGIPYEVANPYAEADLFDIHYVQSADVLTLVHPSYAPRELRRLGALSWALTQIDFAPGIAAPAGVTATPSAVDTTLDYSYVVTATAADGITESQASAAATCTNNLFTTGRKNTISWSAVAGASRYSVYLKSGGVYGYIGQTASLSLVDDNIGPDLAKTPPIYESVFVPNGILSVPVTAGGSGYGSAWTGGAITAVTVGAAGSGYTAPVLTVSDPTGSGATFAITMKPFPNADKIDSIAVTAGGGGYTSPTFVLSDSSGSGASFSASIAPASNAPVLAVTDSTGTGAVLSPVVVGGALTAVRVVSQGQNYSNPTVSISTAAGGVGATFGVPVLTGDEYPAAVSYFEQRRCFAGTPTKPQNIWMTRSGTESAMSYSLPTRDDDRISFRVAARESNTIRHLVPLSNLVALTSAAEWRVSSVNSDALTPGTFSVKPQSYVGASNVQPVIVNNTMLYEAARGGHLREMAYNWQANGFITGDLSLRASHLFDTYTLTDLAYSKSPYPIVWAVRSDGLLLGFTYVPEQQVGAWHQHVTAGAFESVAVVAEGNEDVLYVAVRRTIGGATVRYVERMATRQFSAQEDAFFVDSGLTYRGAPATTISGLGHLEGETVSILADGAVHPQRVVTGGAVELDQAASVVHVGPPYVSDLETLPPALQIDGGYGQGRAKNVNKAWLRVYRSSGIFIGPDPDHLVEAKQRTTEPYGSPPALKSDEVAVTLSPSWGQSGQVYVRQADPLPLTVVGLTLEIALGG